jgi:hypothetical protein
MCSHSAVSQHFMAFHGLGDYSASNRNGYKKIFQKMLLGSKTRPASKADNPTAKYDSIFQTLCDPPHLATQ